MSRLSVIIAFVSLITVVVIVFVAVGTPQVTKQAEIAAELPAIKTDAQSADLAPVVAQIDKPAEPPFKPIEHPVLGPFVTRGAPNRLPTNFPEKVPTITSDDEITAILYVLHDHTDADSIRNEAINLLRRSNVPNLEKHLLQVLDASGEKDRFRSFVVQHLGDMMVEFVGSTNVGDMSRSGYIRDRLILALSDKEISVRRESVLALTKIRDPKVTAVIRSGLQDSAWADAHDLLIRCAFDANLSDLIPEIRPLAYDERTPVRIAAIVALSQWKDEASKPAFEEATRSTVVRIQRAGTLAMRVLESQQ